MKKFILKNLICLLLGVMFLTSSFMTITTLAASQTAQDGVEATLTSGKDSYAANEKIVFCKPKLVKVANHFWRMLHLQNGESCNGLTDLIKDGQKIHCKHYSLVTV